MSKYLILVLLNHLDQIVNAYIQLISALVIMNAQKLLQPCLYIFSTGGRRISSKWRRERLTCWKAEGNPTACDLL